MSEELDVALSEVGEPNTMDFSVYAHSKTARRMISLWHDVPLFPPHSRETRVSNEVHFVCEIPRCTRKKYEISTKETHNPIKQDIKNGRLREFTKGDIYFNYGCLPQTWEDPRFVHPDAGVGGDRDPVDACEIGLRQMRVGEVRRVKILGVLCMIDEGEADWKLIVIDVNDPWAADLHDVADLETLLPGTVSAIREWFRTYKIPDGKPPNVFGLNEECMPVAYAMTVIHETHEAWRRLVSGHRRSASTTKFQLPSLSEVDILQLSQCA
jgi:inorganic pyrophosphatase